MTEQAEQNFVEVSDGVFVDAVVYQPGVGRWVWGGVYGDGFALGA